jgi:hypothetical protein
MMRKLLLITLLAIPCSAQVTLTGVTPNSGPTAGGTPITITGTGLSWSACFPICNQGLVLVGGVPVSVLGNANPNALTIVTPPHAAGTVDIVVFPSNYPNGFTGFTLANAFTYGDPVPLLGARELGALALLLASIAVVAIRMR